MKNKEFTIYRSDMKLTENEIQALRIGEETEEETINRVDVERNTAMKRLLSCPISKGRFVVTGYLNNGERKGSLCPTVFDGINPAITFCNTAGKSTEYEVVYKNGNLIVKTHGPNHNESDFTIRLLSSKGKAVLMETKSGTAMNEIYSPKDYMFRKISANYILPEINVF